MSLFNCLKKKESIHPLVEEALKWVGTMEKGGDNKGPEVEEFQKAVDGKAQKEPWCMAYVQFCIKKVEEKLSLIQLVD